MKSLLALITIAFAAILIGCDSDSISSLSSVTEPDEDVIVPEDSLSISNFTVTELFNEMSTEQMRAVALSPLADIVYLCELTGGSPEVKAIDTTTGVEQNTYNYSGAGRYCKSLDTHSSGRVYFSLSDSDEIGLADADLSNPTFFQTENLLPLVTDSGNNDVDPQQIYVYQNHLYVASDSLGQIYRFNLDPANGDVLSLDTSWGTSGVAQMKDEGGNDIDSSDELLSMLYDPQTERFYAVAEGLDEIISMDKNGTSQEFGIIDIPFGAAPHDIVIFNSFLLITYGASDGSQNMPNGIGVFHRETYEEETVLIDLNNELRNAQGIAVDSVNKVFYVLDGTYGAPNDMSLPRASDAAKQNILLKFTYSEN